MRCAPESGAVVSSLVTGTVITPDRSRHTEAYGTTSQPVGKREADQAHAKHVTKAGAGQLSTSVATFGGYLSRWLDDRSPTWKATTERRNRTIVRPAGARRVHAVLSGALHDAVRNETEGLARNPAEGIRLPRTNVPEANPPTDDGLRLILGAARLKGELWGDYFTFSAYAGLRRGEVAGLRWGDVDGLNSVHVRHSVECVTKSETGATWAITDTKSHQDRNVPLAQPARRAIARRRGETTPDPEAFVFYTTDPLVPIHPDHVSKVFTAAAKTAGVSVTLKDFRSYAATVLDSSAGLKVAQDFLGHRDASTTARHYAGSRTDAVARGLAALNAVDQDTPEITKGVA